MDRVKFREGLKIPSFEGLTTNPARGLVPAPVELTNVLFDKTGGYAPAYSASLQALGVSRAVAAQNGRRLFVQRAADVAYFNPTIFSLTSLTGSSGSTMSAGAAPVMPDLALAEGGAAWLTPTTREAYGRVPPTSRNDAQDASVNTQDPPTVTYAVRPTGSSPNLNPSNTYAFIVVFLPSDTAPYNGIAQFSIPANPLGAGALYLLNIYTNAKNDSVRPVYNLYCSVNGGPYTFVGANFQLSTATYLSSNTQTVFQSGTVQGGFTPALDGAENVVNYTVSGTTPAAYHQGRVWLAPSAYVTRTFEGQSSITTASTALPANRILYSEVISSANNGARPTFFLDNNFDLPFRASTKVTGFMSAGRYLYILGDRELFILTGYDDTTFTIESLGESIGCVADTSIQVLGGVGYYLSDSGLLAVQGGQVQSVGDEVRDITATLNLNTLSSSVDYNREAYYLTDGTTTLVYSTREKKWSTRIVDGTSQALCFGGGTVYSTHSGNLYALSGEGANDGTSPTLLEMTVGWPPFELGDWTTRKGWGGLYVGTDSDGDGVIENLSGTVDWEVGGDYVVPPSRLNVESGVRPARFGMRASKSVAFAPRLRVSPAATTTRMVLRPPLQVVIGDVTDTGA